MCVGQTTLSCIKIFQWTCIYPRVDKGEGALNCIKPRFENLISQVVSANYISYYNYAPINCICGIAPPPPAVRGWVGL